MRRPASLADSLCAHADPVVAWRARRLLARESETSPAMRRLRSAIGTSSMAQQLLKGLRGERFNPYRKWLGPHWTLYSLAEIGYPAGDQRLLPMRERVLDWMFAPAFAKPPSTAIYADQPERPRRFPVEYTNVKQTHHIESRGTYADFGPLSKRKGHPLVTVDALWVLREAGRD